MPNACVGAICSGSRSRGGLEQTRCPDGAGSLVVVADSALRYQTLSALVVPRPRPAAFRRVPTASLLLLVEPDRSPRPATAGDPATSLATDESHLCPHHACEIPERNRLAIALRCAAACSRRLQSPLCVRLSPVPGCRAARAHAESDTGAVSSITQGGWVLF